VINIAARKVAVVHPNTLRLSSDELVGLRREGGLWLRQLREARGLSQRNLAEQVGAEYYTFIAQLEGGRGRIPPDQYLLWAKVLGVEPKLFVQSILRFYDPITFAILFDTVVTPSGQKVSF
jgi:transcriptional regulator with XRE-family HTH domain